MSRLVWSKGTIDQHRVHGQERLVLNEHQLELADYSGY